MSKIASITVTARKWQDSNGNTYFSATILVDGNVVHRIPFEYGYGTHYKDVAFQWLDENGYTDRAPNDKGPREAPFRYCERKGIAFEHDATIVRRKRDL